MPITHYWSETPSGSLSGGLYDASHYGDKKAFVDGDTVDVTGGDASAVSTVAPLDGYGYGLGIGTLHPGTYNFHDLSKNDAFFTLSDVDMVNGVTVAVNGINSLEWTMDRTVINDGSIQLGSAAGSGKADLLFSTGLSSATGVGTGSGPPTPVLLINPTDRPSQLVNNGSITLQNGSVLTTNPESSGATVVNAASGVISVGSGSTATLKNSAGSKPGGSGDTNLQNAGLIAVAGSAGRATGLSIGGSYSGAGTFSVRGASGQAPGSTFATLVGPASGTFNVASGELYFVTTPISGSINFLDNNANLTVGVIPGKSYGAGSTPFGATLNGFQAGDTLDVDTSAAVAGHSYDPATHLLTISGAGGAPVAQFSFAGAYLPSDFQVAPVTLDGTQGFEITTTSTGQAIVPFSYTDTVTGAVGSSAGQQYAGPVNYLQSQYIWASPDGVSIASHVPNVFLTGGAGNNALTASAGRNVLDGGLGSNFLTGATGADGGTDTFFLDGAAGTTWDTIVNFHPGDSATLWGFVAGQSAMVWANNEGAAGHTGATIHAAFAGAGTAINGSLTFAGLSLADAQGKLSLTPGSAGGRSYLYVHYSQ